jgi:hypothetical protein
MSNGTAYTSDSHFAMRFSFRDENSTAPARAEDVLRRWRHAAPNAAPSLHDFAALVNRFGLAAVARAVDDIAEAGHLSSYAVAGVGRLIELRQQAEAVAKEVN